MPKKRITIAFGKPLLGGGRPENCATMPLVKFVAASCRATAVRLPHCWFKAGSFISKGICAIALLRIAALA